MKLNRIAKVGLALAATVPLLALAQAPTAPTVVTTYSQLITIINTIVNWMFGILLAVAVILILYSAFLYLTSGGDEEKVKTAKKYLVYAIIAVAIGIVAKGIVYLIVQLFGATYTPPL